MTNESDAALEGMIVHLSHELKHVKMEIESERSKMKELTSTINKLGGNRSGPESNLITQLEHSQTTLKQELSHAIQSKLELLLEANKEMERLRNIIKIGLSNCFSLFFLFFFVIFPFSFVFCPSSPLEHLLQSFFLFITPTPRS